MRAEKQASPVAAPATANTDDVVTHAELEKLMEKVEQIQEDLAEEKKEAKRVGDEYDKYREKTEKDAENFKEASRNLAKMEIENDEMKSHVRQMGFMLEEM